LRGAIVIEGRPPRSHPSTGPGAHLLVRAVALRLYLRVEPRELATRAPLQPLSQVLHVRDLLPAEEVGLHLVETGDEGLIRLEVDERLRRPAHDGRGHAGEAKQLTELLATAADTPTKKTTSHRDVAQWAPVGTYLTWSARRACASRMERSRFACSARVRSSHCMTKERGDIRRDNANLGVTPPFEASACKLWCDTTFRKPSPWLLIIMTQTTPAERWPSSPSSATTGALALSNARATSGQLSSRLSSELQGLCAPSLPGLGGSPERHSC
jgi:hypothetical protein